MFNLTGFSFKDIYMPELDKKQLAVSLHSCFWPTIFSLLNGALCD
jgi:hypothetical protein